MQLGARCTYVIAPRVTVKPSGQRAGARHGSVPHAELLRTPVRHRSVIVDERLASSPQGILFQHARWTWAALTTTSMVAFLIFVVPQPRYWIDVGAGVERWLAIATVAVLAAVAVLVLLHRRHRAAEALEPSAS